jgi:N6-L-threonylcarbamoyladenine synthase
LNHCNQQKQKKSLLQINNICASFQEAVVDVLVEKTLNAASEYNTKTIVIGGGVSSNTRLRRAFDKRCTEKNLLFYAPEPVFCTDNAAMIALAGYHAFMINGASSLDIDVYSRPQYR